MVSFSCHNCRTDETVMLAAGCNTDIITLRKVIGARLTEYEHSHGRKMSSHAAAQLMSVTLYYRRFFPYYAFCMIAGLDEQGKGAVYGYDAVGSYKRDDYGVMGTGQNFLMPILDNLVSLHVSYLFAFISHSAACIGTTPHHKA
jgi:20S proteasome subunit beta 6